MQYDNEESGQKAIEKLNGMLLNDQPVDVGPFLRKKERENAIDKTRFTTVCVKNLAETTTDEDLENICGQYGETTHAVVWPDIDRNSKCLGFVDLGNADDAVKLWKRIMVRSLMRSGVLEKPRKRLKEKLS